jgi:hypothetical protein
MSINAEPSSLDWAQVGAWTFGLVFAGRIVALVYWQGAEVADLGGPDVALVARDAGFAWVPADLPVDHFFLFEAPNPAEDDWIRARALTAEAYLGWRRREADRTAELRSEAAELLRRSRWWRDERLREQLDGSNAW